MSILDEAVKAGHFTITYQSPSYRDVCDPILSTGELAFLLWDGNAVKFDGEPVRIVERSTFSSYNDRHKESMYVVFETLGKTWIANGRYDSWDGEHFYDYNVQEAVSINIPKWVAKSEAN
jgi:hypothetical protein